MGMAIGAMEAEKEKARLWFTSLRDEIRAAFEGLEREPCSESAPSHPPGEFAVSRTKRRTDGGENAGGGEMSLMRDGRVFEKAGVNISTVYGTLGEEAQKSLAQRREIPGLRESPRFWASGISLVAHMQSPKTPAIHMNTRMFWTPGAWWFGGGADLNPCIDNLGDSAEFHASLKRCCDLRSPDCYREFSEWADRYFYIPHRKRARGAGGIFFDDLNTGDWEADFSFVQEVGRAFLPVFLSITRRHLMEPWTDGDRDVQLRHRGLYAEYNLVYDRGTRFGLQTGHDPDAVLMSLPPLAKW